MTVLKYDDAIKSHVTWVIFSVLFERSYVASQPCKFHSQGLTDLGFRTGSHFETPRLFHAKNPDFLRVKNSSLLLVETDFLLS